MDDPNTRNPSMVGRPAPEAEEAPAPEPPASAPAPAPAPAAPETEPATFGAWLVRARQKRGLSMDEVAHMTKIRRAILEALERDARRELPEKVFVTGYVRSYAHAVGLDADETQRRFNEAWPDDAGPAADENAEPPPERSWAWVGPVLAAVVMAAVLWFIVKVL